MTVPPTATATASSLQLPPDLQAGSISSAPFCPFTPAFPMRHFSLLPQLLTAPLLAGSLFILPLSIAEAQEGNNTLYNNEVHLLEVVTGLLGDAVAGLLGAAVGGGAGVLWLSRGRLEKLEKIYEKIIKIDNDLENLEKLGSGVTEKIEKIDSSLQKIIIKADNNNKSLVDIQNSNKDLNDSIQNLNSKLDNDLENLEKLSGGVTEKIEKVNSNLQKINIEIDNNNKSLIDIKDSNKDLNDSIQNLNSKLDGNRQKILERINEIPSKIQSS